MQYGCRGGSLHGEAMSCTSLMFQQSLSIAVQQGVQSISTFETISRRSHFGTCVTSDLLAPEPRGGKPS